jgi:hypothetical protein
MFPLQNIIVLVIIFFAGAILWYAPSYFNSLFFKKSQGNTNSRGGNKKMKKYKISKNKK